MYRTIFQPLKGYEERYLAFINSNENMTLSTLQKAKWYGNVVTAVIIGKEASEVCPVCLHPQAYFEEKKENC